MLKLSNNLITIIHKIILLYYFCSPDNALTFDNLTTYYTTKENQNKLHT